MSSFANFKTASAYKGIRARLGTLFATKGNLINKGCKTNTIRKTMLSGTELLCLSN
ncbi:MAG: hypothetical protein LBL39_07190 [Planctomycetaceae bacterium]|nr:hypothetical protein [Planctomycetaceae bacterium]